MNEEAFKKLEIAEKIRIENNEDQESDGYEQENLLKAETGKYFNLSNSSCSFDLADV